MADKIRVKPHPSLGPRRSIIGLFMNRMLMCSKEGFFTLPDPRYISEMGVG